MVLNNKWVKGRSKGNKDYPMTDKNRSPAASHLWDAG